MVQAARDNETRTLALGYPVRQVQLVNFVIGGALVGLQTRGMRRDVSAIALGKLLLHPLAVGLAAWALRVEPVAAGVMVAAAALPVAGNVYILAQYFGVAQQRVSAAILISTAASIVTIPLAMLLIGQA